MRKRGDRAKDRENLEAFNWTVRPSLLVHKNTTTQQLNTLDEFHLTQHRRFNRLQIEHSIGIFGFAARVGVVSVLATSPFVAIVPCNRLRHRSHRLGDAGDTGY